MDTLEERIIFYPSSRGTGTGEFDRISEVCHYGRHYRRTSEFGRILEVRHYGSGSGNWLEYPSSGIILEARDKPERAAEFRVLVSLDISPYTPQRGAEESIWRLSRDTTGPGSIGAIQTELEEARSKNGRKT